MKQLLALLALFYALTCTAQDHKDLEILEADSTWSKELIKFPLSFAKAINYQGYEDIRFAQNWKTPESSEFFAYAFVWNIDLKELPTVGLLESQLRLYYDGLMTAVNKDKDVTVPPSEIDFEKELGKTELPRFNGRMKVYDAFFTRVTMTLYAEVETFYCKTQGRYVLLFRIATKGFEDMVWHKLNDITLAKNYCEKGVGN